MATEPCLPRLRSGAYIQVDVGPTNTHLFKENSRQFLVAILSGVHQERLYKIVRKHRGEKGCDLHQIRPGANNTEDFHFNQNQNLLARSASSIKDFQNFTELASLRSKNSEVAFTLIYSLTAFDQRCDPQLTSKFIRAKNPGEKSSRNRLRGGFQGAQGDGAQNNYGREDGDP
jgi:hypothetical protein